MLRKELIKFIESFHQTLDKKLNVHDDDAPFLIIMFTAMLVFAFGLYAFIDLTRDLFNEGLDHFDDQVIEKVFSWRNDTFTDIMILITDFGDIAAYIIMTGLICGLFYYLFRNWKYIAQVCVVLLLSSLMNVWLKVLFARERPESTVHLVEAYSLSYPSGHAMSAFAFYGFLIYLAWRLLDKAWTKIVATIVCGLIILAIGFSRVYLGVHYPSDVIAGFLGGLIWLTLCIIIFNLISLLRIRRGREKEIPDTEIEEHVIKHEE